MPVPVTAHSVFDTQLEISSGVDPGLSLKCFALLSRKRKRPSKPRSVDKLLLERCFLAKLVHNMRAHSGWQTLHNLLFLLANWRVVDDLLDEAAKDHDDSVKTAPTGTSFREEA